MASTWGSIGRKLGDFAVAQGPKLLKQLQNSGTVKRATEAISGSGHPGVKPGRPVAHSSAPTAHRARRIEYSPSLDGQADPGEVVWTWVAYEEDPRQGKDRPVLVVGRDGHTLLGLMLSSNRERDDDRNWLARAPARGIRSTAPAGFAWIGCSTSRSRASAARAPFSIATASTRSPRACDRTTAGAEFSNNQRKGTAASPCGEPCPSLNAVSR